MRLGIFAKTFPRSSLEETLDAVRAYGRAACSSIVSERDCPKRGRSNASTVDLAGIRTPKRAEKYHFGVP